MIHGYTGHIRNLQRKRTSYLSGTRSINKPEVIIKDGGLSIKATDPVIGLDIEIEADMLTLATAIVPYKDEKLARFFKIPVNDDGFFMEKHAKLGPSDFATDGVFLCGLAHYPKPVEEAITHGQAAASRATTLLAQQTINTSGNISCVNTVMCSGCGVSVVLCPFSAASIMKEGPFAGKSEINLVLCKGCGLCVASCRSGAIHLKGFETQQIMAMIEAWPKVS